MKDDGTGLVLGVLGVLAMAGAARGSRSSGGPVRLKVNLKWSAWSAHVETWREKLIEESAFDSMVVAFDGRGPIVDITSSPSKEIRTGWIRIFKGGASGHFTFEWDAAHDHVPDSVPSDLYEDVAELIWGWRIDAGFNEDSYTHDFVVEAGSFEQLLVAVDAEEEALLQKERELSDQFDIDFTVPRSLISRKTWLARIEGSSFG